MKNCSKNKPITVMMMDITKTMHDRMRAHGESLGLQKGFHRIIFELSKNGPKTQNELADATRLSSPTVSVALQNMERAGLVERVQDENDLRKINVVLSEKGFEMHRKIGEKIKENDRLFFEGLTEDEIETLQKIVTRIYNNFASEENGR